MKPADIHLLALDCEPVWLKQFLGQRHFVPANDAGGDHCERLGPALLSVPFHSATDSRGGQDNRATQS